MHKGAKYSGERFLHPAVYVLVAVIGLVLVARYLGPTRDRRKAMRDAVERSSSGQLAPLLSEEEKKPVDKKPLTLRYTAVDFEEWFLDLEKDREVCAFDYVPPASGHFVVNHQVLDHGIELLMSAQDLAFLAWTSSTYHLNPHFLLGVMMAESAGDCSAVSYAGAQGCFQITYTQGAGQLMNSYPERTESWYWAPRSNPGPERHRRPGEALGYWPADLYVPPSDYFGQEVAGGSRQLRMTWDPVATTMASDRAGDTEVSSVANFSFGIVGAGLYYHYLNHYLLDHELQIKKEINDLVANEGLKVRWMAAAYNQGSPRTMRLLGEYGAGKFLDHTAEDVVNYSETVADFCRQFQSGAQSYDGTMTWGEFSDFLEQLRWTYSEVPIDWLPLREEIRQRFFPEGGSITLSGDLLRIFSVMRSLEPALEPEIPIVDHHVKF